MNSCERKLRRWLMDSICVKLSAICVAAPVVSCRSSTHHDASASFALASRLVGVILLEPVSSLA